MRTPLGTHDGLQWLAASERGRQWLSTLDDVVDELAEKWSLSIQEPFGYAFTSIALPVTRSDRSPAVLKVQFPDRESEYEAAALEHWGGLGAVRLFAWDRERRALLLERCLPGTPLADTDPDFALGVLTQLVNRLSIRDWRIVEGKFVTLGDRVLPCYSFPCCTLLHGDVARADLSRAHYAARE
jgi:streptomycin 6-kinase